MQLVWDRDPSARIAGYAVYRSVAPLRRWERLTDRPFPFASFVDWSPLVGQARYWVTAIGPDGTESAEGYAVDVAVTEVVPASKPAALFEKNDIISDGQLTELAALPSVEKIQGFLDARGGALATYSTADRYDGGTTKSAARLIFDASHAWSISPHVVLTTLQKEKSLVTSKTANPANFAMGWNETVGSTSDFAAQVYKGARQFRLYFDRFTTDPGYYTDRNGKPWAVGQTMAVEDGSVTPVNKATAGLYIYTPWIGGGGGGQSGKGGNYLFWDLWYNVFAFGSALAAPAKPKTLGPGSLDAAQAEIVTSTGPTLTWEAVAGAQLYEIYVSREPYGAENLVYENLYVAGALASFGLPAGTLVSGVRYRWNMAATNLAGTSDFSDRRYFRVEVATEAAHGGAATQVGAADAGYSLEQNFPNPFNAVTSIRFTLPSAGEAKITVFDLAGREVSVLAEGHFAAGTHQVSWRADSVGSGVYFCRLEAGAFTETKRLVLAR